MLRLLLNSYFYPSHHVGMLRLLSFHSSFYPSHHVGMLRLLLHSSRESLKASKLCASNGLIVGSTFIISKLKTYAVLHQIIWWIRSSIALLVVVHNKLTQLFISMRSRHSVNSTLNSFLLFIPISEAIPSQVCVVIGERSGYHTAGYIQAILPDPPLSSFRFHIQIHFYYVLT